MRLCPLVVAVIFCALPAPSSADDKPPQPPAQTADSVQQASPSFLQRIFKEALRPEQFAVLGPNAAPEQLAGTMQADQKEVARAKLKDLEKTATDDQLPVIQHGYELLGASIDGMRIGLMRQGKLPRSSADLTRQAAQAAAEGRKDDAMRLAAEALARNPDDEEAYKILKLVPPKDIGRNVNPQDPFSQDSSVVKPDTSVGQAEPSRPPNAQAQTLMRQAIQARKIADMDGTFSLALGAIRADPTSNTVQQFYGVVLQDREKQMRRLSTTINFLNQSIDASNAGNNAQALVFANQAFAINPSPVIRKYIEELRTRPSQAQAAPQRSPLAPTNRNLPPAVPIGGGGLLFAIGAWVAKKDRDTERASSENPKRTVGLAIMAVGAFGVAAGVGVALEGFGLLSGLGGAAVVNGAAVTAGASAAAGGVATTAVGAKLASDGYSYSRKEEGHSSTGADKRNDVYQNVEIHDERGGALGEFDEIDLKRGEERFIENKDAGGLGTKVPGTGEPNQSPGQWAEKQIYDKTVNRIENLRQAAGTRPADGPTRAVPQLAQIRGIRSLEFRIETDTPEIRDAVGQQIQRLGSKYPDWRFSATFGR